MIAFDLDGPVLDVSEKYYQIYSAVVSELGGVPLEKFDYWNRKRLRKPDSSILVDSGLDKDGKASIFTKERLMRIETEAYWRYDRVWTALQNYMATSPVRGGLVLVTLRNRADALHAELRALGVDDWFDTVLSASGDVAGRDRHEMKVKLVREKYGSSVKGWFIGDTETDIRAGRALGLNTAAATFGIRDESLLKREAPHVILRTPGDLVAWLTSVEDTL